MCDQHVEGRTMEEPNSCDEQFCVVGRSTYLEPAVEWALTVRSRKRECSEPHGGENLREDWFAVVFDGLPAKWVPAVLVEPIP
ncbi:hypothetical protein ABIF38_005065 [Bradyrhizobium japonicum]|nr:hypothetical protein [Bradyrhizobium elkanii]MCW2111748.1 hypothetical protein [Bradyrhizobium elkanii]MCW2199898.1 hypothetical protein [Bradyrhizobium elkanii]MCW2228551.1 hypothetical protein [Bradyrhizobium elkanii]